VPEDCGQLAIDSNRPQTLTRQRKSMRKNPIHRQFQLLETVDMPIIWADIRATVRWQIDQVVEVKREFISRPLKKEYFGRREHHLVQTNNR